MKRKHQKNLPLKPIIVIVIVAVALYFIITLAISQGSCLPNWIKDYGNSHPSPMVTPTENRWDGAFLDSPFVLKNDGTYEMWYTGGDDLSLKTGETTIKTCRVVSGDCGAGCTTPNAFDFSNQLGVDYRNYLYYDSYFDGVSLKDTRFSLMGTDDSTWDSTTFTTCQGVTYRTGDVSLFRTDSTCKTGYVYCIETKEKLYAKIQIELPCNKCDQVSFRYYFWDSGDKIGYASSTDGLIWTKTEYPVMYGTLGSWDSERVRDPMVIKEISMYKMWYTGYGTDMIPKIGYATYSGGLYWEKLGIVIDAGPPGSWDQSGVKAPSVLKLSDTDYRMWYVSGGSIGYATSIDGINWNKYSGNPVLYNVGADNVEVLYNEYTGGGTVYPVYRMWFNHNNMITAAYSFDGINWNIRNDPITVGVETWDQNTIEAPTVLQEPSTSEYRMWYDGSGDGSNGPVSGIGHATTQACDIDKDGFPSDIDCNDENPNIWISSPEICDGKDNDCDTLIDEDLTQACGTGNCMGVATCVNGGWQCSTNGLPCNNDNNVCTVDTCNIDGNCVFTKYLSCGEVGSKCTGGGGTCNPITGCPGDPVDCTPYNSEEVSTCTYTPDGNPYTLDYRPSFVSQCTETTGECTTVGQEISHTCSVAVCGAGCDDSSVWQDSCNGNIRMYGGTCISDTCTWNYDTEDCNKQDGLYPTANLRYIPYPTCKIILQREWEYRDYSCGQGSCNYVVTKTEWRDTGYIEDNDVDKDGVCDNVDKCLGSVIPESVPREALRPNNYAQSDADLMFEKNTGSASKPIISDSNYNMATTYGCTCDQILHCKPGDSNGEFKWGCSEGTMNVWINQKGWSLACQTNGKVTLYGEKKPLLADEDGNGIPDIFEMDNDHDGLPDNVDVMADDSDSPGTSGYGIPDWWETQHPGAV